MSCIVEIAKLRDKFLGQKFGYVGVDLETGKIRYFTSFDNTGIYHLNSLYEFDINNPKTEFLRKFLSRCDYKRESFSSELPSEFKSLVDTAINKHREFNQKKGYPLNDLDFNKENLSVTYQCASSNDPNYGFLGFYVCVENLLALSVNKLEMPYLDEEIIKLFDDVILHEVGHMKVSSAYFDNKNNELYFRTGFKNLKMLLKPVQLKSNDIFLKNINNNVKGLNQRENILEELFNDLECKLINQTYQPAFPYCGIYLDALSDGKLAQARYSNGIDEYYESMTSLIPSYSMADEVLDSIIETTYGAECEYAKNQAYTLKLINKYAEVKNKKR